MARCVTFAVARIRVGNRPNFCIFFSGTENVGVRRSKKAHRGPRTGIYLVTKFGCDRSIVVGCRSRNDRQTDKQNGMTIRLTLCERDATQTDRWSRRKVYRPSSNTAYAVLIESDALIIVDDYGGEYEISSVDDKSVSSRRRSNSAKKRVSCLKFSRKGVNKIPSFYRSE